MSWGGACAFYVRITLDRCGFDSRGRSLSVRKLSILILPVLAACVLAVPSQAGESGARGFPPGWSHATINVMIKRQPHTLIYDRGRVQAVIVDARSP